MFAESSSSRRVPDKVLGLRSSLALPRSKLQLMRKKELGKQEKKD
jgi:hypothetical protein